MFCWVVCQRKGEQHHVSVAVGHQVYSFGGDKGDKKDTDQIEVHVFNTVSLGWKKLPSVTAGREDHLEVPSMRWGHTAVLVEDTVYLWGGCKYYEYHNNLLDIYYSIARDGYYNVLYGFDVDTHRWVKPRTSGTVPEARAGHSACVLGKIMYVYGGTMKFEDRLKSEYHKSNIYLSIRGIYKLDITTMVWSFIKSRRIASPLPSGHSATIVGKNMFVFGGCHYDNINVFDTETDCWLTTPSARVRPEVRTCHSAFTYHGELYIVSGYRGEQHFKDLWKFNPETFSWKKVWARVKGSSRIMGCSMVGHCITIGGSKGRYLYLRVLDLSPSLKTLCKIHFIRYSLKSSVLPHNIRWELLAMTDIDTENKQRSVEKSNLGSK